MTRSRKSARDAGAKFEREVSEHLAGMLPHQHIERRARNGAKDRGDVGGVHHQNGGRVVVEVKNTARADLAGWIREAEQERVNDGAEFGVVVHKRHGVGDLASQWVLMDLDTLGRLLGGRRDAAPPAVSDDTPLPGL